MKKTRSAQGQKKQNPKGHTVKVNRSKSRMNKLMKRPAVICAFNLSEPCHHDTLTVLYELWDEWNTTFFYGLFSGNEPVIIIEPLLDCTYQGYYEPGNDPEDQEDFSSIRLCETILTGKENLLWKEGNAYAEGRFRYVADLMLHEMVHAFAIMWWQAPTNDIDWYELANQDSQRKGLFLHSMGRKGVEALHHGIVFCSMCNVIADRLNLKHVRYADIEDWEYGQPGHDRGNPLCDYFPMDVRPDGYYLNARGGDPD